MGLRVPILLGHLQTQRAKAEGGFVAPTPLHAAAASGDLEKLQAAIDAAALVGVDLDARDAFGATALFAAAASSGAARSSGAVSLLLAAGADPRVAADDGRTALHAAARACCPESVEALLKAGAEAFDASARRGESSRDDGSGGSGGGGRDDGDGGGNNDSLRTPFHEAAAAGGAPGTSERAGEVTELLLDAVARSCRSSGGGGGDGDADVAAQAKTSEAKAEAASAGDRFGRTPLHEALSAGALHCARALAAAGADLSARAWDGGNALHAGAAAGKSAALAACLEAAAAASSSSSTRSPSSTSSPSLIAIDAALGARDASGKTPAEAAAAAGKREAAAVLKKARGEEVRRVGGKLRDERFF